VLLITVLTLPNKKCCYPVLIEEYVDAAFLYTSVMYLVWQKTNRYYLTKRKWLLWNPAKTKRSEKRMSVCNPYLLHLMFRVLTFSVCDGTFCLRAWTSDKCLATKHHQTLFGAVWTPCLVLFDRVCMCLVVFDKIWRPSNIQATT